MDEALRAVADPTRRAILVLVRDEEVSAGDIARGFPGISRPAVSQHLRILVTAGLLDVRRAGNRRFYRMRRQGLAEAATFFESMWSAPLNRLKQVAEEEESAEGSP
ncbi:metalloregulator ArsR/SmtB family transcription factor [Nonomuraea longicatena]|uniref:Metalloregulator ArsR/SmtB family transcription factor n=1 Tax=Nonomuraea longicatena TaxID=83682 RepID=A0ABN1QA64_9ACTN